MDREDKRSQGENVVLAASKGAESGRSGNEKMDPIEYRLYVGPLQEVPDGVEFSYYDSRRGYLFLLTDKEPSGRFALMTDELMSEMTDYERAWYNRSCFIINGRWVAAHEEESREQVESFLADFEAELKKEAAKIKEQEHEQDEDSRAGISSDSDSEV